MSFWMNYQITAQLKGPWDTASIDLLNRAMSEWWITDDWDYSSFFSELHFAPDALECGPVEGSSNRTIFLEILAIALNGSYQGEDEFWEGSGEEYPLEERESYDPEADQALKGAMHEKGLSIHFQVETHYEGDDEDQWETLHYQVQSDGKRYLVR